MKILLKGDDVSTATTLISIEAGADDRVVKPFD